MLQDPAAAEMDAELGLSSLPRWPGGFGWIRINTVTPLKMTSVNHTVFNVIVLIGTSSV